MVYLSSDAIKQINTPLILSSTTLALPPWHSSVHKNLMFLLYLRFCFSSLATPASLPFFLSSGLPLFFFARVALAFHVHHHSASLFSQIFESRLTPTRLQSPFSSFLGPCNPIPYMSSTYIPSFYIASFLFFMLRPICVTSDFFHLPQFKDSSNRFNYRMVLSSKPALRKHNGLLNNKSSSDIA